MQQALLSNDKVVQPSGARWRAVQSVPARPFMSSLSSIAVVLLVDRWHPMITQPNRIVCLNTSTLFAFLFPRRSVSPTCSTVCLYTYAYALVSFHTSVHKQRSRNIYAHALKKVLKYVIRKPSCRSTLRIA